MDKRNKSTLPGLIISKNSTSSLEGIKNAKGGRGSSALPIMKYLGNVKPSRNERIIKPDMTSSGKITKQDLPIIREVLQPGFSGNFRTNYTPPSAPSAFDADAIAYFTAAGITDTTEKNAVNQLVLDLKGTGSTTNNTDVWTDSDVISPISPTSLAAAAFNLKNPATFQTTWYNTPTHSTNGVSGNGTTQYGDVGWNPSTDGLQDNVGITVAINTDVTTNTNDCGVRNGSASFFQVLSHYSGAANSVINQIALAFPTAANATSLGVYTGVRTSSTAVGLYKNGASIATSSRVSVAPPNGNVFLLARNLIGTGAESFTTRRFTFAAIHKGLTANQAQDLYDAITNYNRTVLAGTLDSDALAYIEAAGITDRVECAAVNQLVKDLKGTGSTPNGTDLWTDAVQVLGVSPTSLDASKYNIKNTAKNLTYFNSPTHAAGGVTFNGTNQYAATGVIPSSDGLDSFTLTIALGGTTTDTSFGRMITVNQGVGKRLQLYQTAGNLISDIYNSSSITAATTTTSGFFTATSTSNSDGRIFKGATKLATDVSLAGTVPDLELYIGALNNSGSPQNYSVFTFNCAYTSAAGYDDNGIADLNDAFNRYNTALNR